MLLMKECSKVESFLAQLLNTGCCHTVVTGADQKYSGTRLFL